MSDSTLNSLDDGTETIELQLLGEFKRLRETEPDETFCSIDAGVSDPMGETVKRLWHELEHSGDANNLSLITDRYEIVAARLIAIRKLLDAQISTTLLFEVHQEVLRANRKPGSATRSRQPSVEPEPAKKGLFGSIKDRLGSKQSDPAPRAKAKPATPKPDSENYQDKGVGTPSREIAMLAARFETGGDDKELMEAAMNGKAVFQSRELSSAALAAKQREAKNSAPVPDTSSPSTFQARELSSPTMQSKSPTGRSVAQTPEEIRKKLEGGERATGASQFQSRELSSAPPQTVKNPKTKSAKRQAPADVAKTPEEIRRKLSERQSQTQDGRAAFAAKDIEPVAAVPPKKKVSEQKPPPSGKAAFTVKDVKSIAPQEARPKKKPPEKKEQERTGGKAVFESRDLSNPPPTEKK